MDNLKMHEQLATLRAQRDELLAALETFCGIYPPNSRNHPDVMMALAQARAAIAKARG